MPEIDPAKKAKIAIMAERIYKLGQSDKTGFEKLKEEVKNLKTKVKDLQTELKNTKSGSSSELVKLASKVTKKLESGEDSTELRDVKLIANSFAIKETVTTTDVDKLIEKLSLIRSKVAKPAKAKKEQVAQPA
ncbi:MAG: hypothetical protein KGI08_08385 [Thaumarchaeota archaeon]|nr:hypothetical protein [Nitrososphaerota archaeon]